MQKPSTAFDPNDAETLERIFTAPQKSLTKEEKAFVQQVRYKSAVVEDMKLLDFTSNTLSSIRDGNTISEGMWLRRGLPKLQAYHPEWKAPKNLKVALHSQVKTNGDCCMFSWVEFEEGDSVDGMFLIATRNQSTLAQNAEHLKKSTAKMPLLKEIGSLWFAHIKRQDKKRLAELKKLLSGKTWVGEYLSSDSLVNYAQNEVVLHSIVDNETGNQLANASATFSKFGFPHLPHQNHGTFILEETELEAKVQELYVKTLAKSIGETQEGLVL